MIRRFLSRESPLRNSPTRQKSSDADLTSLRKLDDLLTCFARCEGKDSLSNISRQIETHGWIQSMFNIINRQNTSLTDLRFLTKVYEKTVDFIISGSHDPPHDASVQMIIANSTALYAFLDKLSSDEVRYYGARLWLAHAKLIVTAFEAKLLTKEWNEVLSPMKKWVEVCGAETVVLCLHVWSSFIKFFNPKLTAEILEKELFSSLTKPLHSQVVVNKLSEPSPIIETYMSLLSVFANNINELFEELVISFLQFLLGRPTSVMHDIRSIEDEITKPINMTESIVLQGNPCEFPDYLVGSQSHRMFEEALKHVFPLISAILGVAPKQGVPECRMNSEVIRKYGVFLTQALRMASYLTNDGSRVHPMCFCFAALARRVENIENSHIRHRESHLLFLQVKAWVVEHNHTNDELEVALCHLFRPRDLSIYANTIGEWPAKNILTALLGISSSKISDFLDLMPRTICSELNTNEIVLKRTGELCCIIKANLDCFLVQALLSTWDSLAAILKNYTKETDDINEGTLLKPNFSTTFSFLRLLFRVANRANEDSDMDLLRKCSTSFKELYLEVQTTVRHEMNCGAETVLCSVFGNAVLPETLCCTNLYISTIAYVMDIYPFNSFQKEVYPGSSIEFNSLGDGSAFVTVIQFVSSKLMSLAHMVENEKLPHSLLVNFLLVLEACRKLFTVIEKPSLVRSVFLALSEVLSEIHVMIFGNESYVTRRRYNAVVAFTKILESVQNNISGPYDDSLLSGCEQLLIRLLSGFKHRRPKLCVTACKLWMKTFAGAKSLKYSTNMRQVLLPLVKKRVIYAPGLSTEKYDVGEIKEDIDDASFWTSYCSKSLSPKPGVAKPSNIIRMKEVNGEEKTSRTGRKRSWSDTNYDENLDSAEASTAQKVENSGVDVESAPIESKTMDKPSPRHVRIRRQKYTGLLDEDSVEYVPIVSAESAKKMKLTERQREMFSEKRERMPFLDDDSQHSAVIAHLPMEFDTESSRTFSNNTEKPVTNDNSKHGISDVCSAATGTESGRSFSCNPGLTDEVTSTVVTDHRTPVRKSKVRLNFDQVLINGDTLEGFASNDTEVMVPESSTSFDQTNKAMSMNAKISSDEQSIKQSSVDNGIEYLNEENLVRSHRTRSRRTPTKYPGWRRKGASGNDENVQRTRSKRSATKHTGWSELSESGNDENDQRTRSKRSATKHTGWSELSESGNDENDQRTRSKRLAKKHTGWSELSGSGNDENDQRTRLKRTSPKYLGERGTRTSKCDENVMETHSLSAKKRDELKHQKLQETPSLYPRRRRERASKNDGSMGGTISKKTLTIRRGRRASKSVGSVLETSIEAQPKEGLCCRVTVIEGGRKFVELNDPKVLTENDHFDNNELILREMEDTFNVKDSLNTSLEESMEIVDSMNTNKEAIADSKDDHRDVSKTPDKQETQYDEKDVSKTPDKQGTKDDEMDASKTPDKQGTQYDDKDVSKTPDKQGTKDDEMDASKTPDKQRAKDDEMDASKTPDKQRVKDDEMDASKTPDKQGTKDDEMDASKTPDKQGTKDDEVDVLKTPDKQGAKDDEMDNTKTPEKQCQFSEKMEDVFTPTALQRVIGTPGILKKVNSPSTAEKKLRRVHFDETLENGISVVAHAPVEEESTATLPAFENSASLMGIEADFNNAIDDDPIFPQLADCEESIGKIVGKLFSISTATGALTARKALEAKGIVEIRHLACLSRRKVLLLNIRKPRIETALRALSQFARDYAKNDSVSVVNEISISVSKEAPLDVAKIAIPSQLINTISISATFTSQQHPTVDSRAKKRTDSAVIECPTNDHLQLLPEQHSQSDEKVEDMVDKSVVIQSGCVELRPEQDPENSENIDGMTGKLVVGQSALLIEKRQRWKRVLEAFQNTTDVVGNDEAEGYIQLKRAALNTAKALIDLIGWCDERNG